VQQDRPDLKVHVEVLVHKDHRESKAIKAYKVTKVLQELQELQVQQVRQDYVVFRDSPEQPVQQVILDIRVPLGLAIRGTRV
jgi:hypothetical protein